MIAGLFLLLLAIAGGTVLTFWFDWTASLPARICTGAGIGLALLASGGYLVSLWLGLTAASLSISALIVACPIGLLASADYRSRVRESLRDARQKASLAWQNRSRAALIYVLFY